MYMLVSLRESCLSNRTLFSQHNKYKNVSNVHLNGVNLKNYVYFVYMYIIYVLQEEFRGFSFVNKDFNPQPAAAAAPAAAAGAATATATPAAAH